MAEGVSEQAPTHVVVLVHGIRTRALWQGQISSLLEAAGFEVARTNYGLFDLIRFLLPIPYFRNLAMAKVWRQIEDVVFQYTFVRPGPFKISVIAHSFGSYIVLNLFRSKFNFVAENIILCGSIVNYNFPFEGFAQRFRNILNEVSTNDFWPVLASRVTIGYGSTGTYGFNRFRVVDSVNNGRGHSGLLSDPDIVRERWIPFLQNGEVGGTPIAVSPDGAGPPRAIGDKPRRSWTLSAAGLAALGLAFLAYAALAFGVVKGVQAATAPRLYIEANWENKAVEKLPEWVQLKSFVFGSREEVLLDDPNYVRVVEAEGYVVYVELLRENRSSFLREIEVERVTTNSHFPNSVTVRVFMRQRQG